MKHHSAGCRILLSLAVALPLIYMVSAQSPLQVGYSVFTADAGSRTPVASALFTFTSSNGVLVSQAGVSAVEPIRAGRVLVDEARAKTGLALVNNSSGTATTTFILRNAAGIEIGRRSESLGPGRQLARFVNELFPTQAVGLLGSLTFESNQPFAAVTLRESRNARGEALYTTLPVVDLAAASSTEPAAFPHIAAGGGYTTELLLMNPGTDTMRGEVRLYDSNGRPLSLQSEGRTVSQVSYEISSNGTFRAEFGLDAASTSSGWALAVPAAGSRTPSGSVIFQSRANNQVVTEAGVAATPATTSARIFVDNAGTRTGVAIANPSSGAAELTLTLMDRSGNVEETVSRTLPAGNHLARFTHELFSSLTEGFTGVMEIRSNVAVTPITLKLTVNSRGDTVLTTLPVADTTRLSTAATLIFPQIAVGGEFSTRLIFINPDTSTAVSGRLSFYQSDANNMVVPMGAETGSQFLYRLAAGGGRQFYPGNAARAASIILMDASTNTETRELVINEGNVIRPRVRILDGTGQSRDDFDISFTSSNSDIAVVNADGSIAGKGAGFSTLTMSAAGVVSTGTITVVGVESGVSGFEIVGIAQDLARRVYLASSQDHTILLAQDVRQTPATYAGMSRSPGLKNDLRLQSQFKNPAFLAFHQAEGSLYVTDSANHVIRRVRPGASGRVETLAGTSSAGSRDGPLQQASFNAPQGIALDSRGNLWVADSGNHSIRRISLVTGTVETIAGTPGVAGFADGKANQAQFRSPMGIAVETESTVHELERERRGDPPPPVSVIVADTGNGALRRVRENGDVETLRVESSRAASFENFKSGATSAVRAPIALNKPAGVVVDAFENIYVSEPDSGRVKMIMPSGEVVSATQANTLRGPKGLAITQSGRIVVAESRRSALEIRYGEPQIRSVVPDALSINGGESVTIRGTNFASDTVVVIGGLLIAKAEVRDTETIVFNAPVLASGRTTLTVQNRGGLSQRPLLVNAIPLSDLPAGHITTVAGGTTFIGDGGPATSAGLAFPKAVAVDAVGNLFIADTRNHRIRRIAAATGIMTTVAGDGQFGGSGDGGPAIAAQLLDPVGIAVDIGGNLFIADGSRIRKVHAATGNITTVAGSFATNGFAGDGGPATAAQLNQPMAIAIDAAGNLFVADRHNHRVRRIDAVTGIISTIAGTGEAGYSGDGGPATAATLREPTGIAVDSNGNVFVVDSRNERVRRIQPATGIISTIAGTGEAGFTGDDGLAIAAQFRLFNTWLPGGIAIDHSGNLFIADTYNARLRKVSATTGIVTTVAGGRFGFAGDGGPAANAQFINQSGIAVDSSGNLFITDTSNQRVRKIDASTGFITTLAGIGEIGLTGDGGPATSAQLRFPSSVVFDAGGNLFLTDTYNYRVRRVEAATGMVSTVAGNGSSGFSGDDGPATAAELNSPLGVAVDPRGNLFVANSDFGVIRRIDAVTGIITTIAGTGRCCGGFSGDGGAARAAQLLRPSQIAFDGLQNLFVADTGNNRIRRIDLDTGLITTFAGVGEQGFSGDGGPATAARLAGPEGIAFDREGNLFMADTLNHRIRRVAAATGAISTVAGTGVQADRGIFGDEGPAVLARLSYPGGVAIDSAGNLFIADSRSHRIRRVDAATGIITTLAGYGWSSAGDGGPASAADFRNPIGLAFDVHGNLFIADAFNNRIRAIRGPLP